MSIHQDPKEVAMSGFRSIEIDFDVHKAIEAERRSFAEKENEVLRRLLKLPPAPVVPPVPATPGQRAWSGENATLPHGTLLQMTYNGRTHEGQIIDGKWVVEGKSFDSPSGAASGTARTRDGRNPSLDGWSYWLVKRPDDANWVRLGNLRRLRRLTGA